MLLEQLILKMIEYDKGDARRIQHFMKVHDFARTIGRLEGLDETTQMVIEAAAIVHDIGIHVCEEKYGNEDGKMQEKEGPPLAKEMLSDLGFESGIIERVCYLVGHHHTYSKIDGVDYQILVEADFLVNLYENQSSKEEVAHALLRIFKTEAGSKICRDMFDLNTSGQPSDASGVAD